MGFLFPQVWCRAPYPPLWINFESIQSGGEETFVAFLSDNASVNCKTAKLAGVLHLPCHKHTHALDIGKWIKWGGNLQLSKLAEIATRLFLCCFTLQVNQLNLKVKYVSMLSKSGISCLLLKAVQSSAAFSVWPETYGLVPWKHANGQRRPVLPHALWTFVITLLNCPNMMTPRWFLNKQAYQV